VLLKKYEVYTISEFLNKEGDLKKIDRFISHLKKDKIKYLKVVVILALLIPGTTLKVFADSFITDTGLQYYDYIKQLGYVICLFGAAVEAIKCVATGTLDQISKIAIKYAAFGLLIVFLPKFVNLIFSIGGN